jgi:simple sugar transport system ATP-binding protein
VGAERDTVLSARSLDRSGVVGPIDFELKNGEVLGLAGLLGSGRSETARMLFGIDPADHGEIQVRGKRVTIRLPLDAIRNGLAFSGEDRKVEGIIPDLSVRENLVLALQASKGTLNKLGVAEQLKLAQHYIAALKIKTPSVETPIKLLSGGNQQKVLLARWLAMQPDIIILDEPTRGIDVGAKAEIEKLNASLSEKGVATVLISSELEEITRKCSRGEELRDRKQVGELTGDGIEPDRVMHTIAQHTDDFHGHPSKAPPEEREVKADG